jgi:hypothetical protein
MKASMSNPKKNVLSPSETGDSAVSSKFKSRYIDQQASPPQQNKSFSIKTKMSPPKIREPSPGKINPELTGFENNRVSVENKIDAERTWEFKIKLIKIADKLTAKKKKVMFKGLIELKVFKTLISNDKISVPPYYYSDYSHGGGTN